MLNCFSHVQLCAALRTVAFCPWDSPDKNAGVGCHVLPPPGDLPNSGVLPTSLASSALVGEFFTTSATWDGPATGHWVVNEYPTAFQPQGVTGRREMGGGREESREERNRNLPHSGLKLLWEDIC